MTRDSGEVVALLLPDSARTKILVTRDGTEILYAALGLEGVALWFQRTVRVVLCVSDRCDGSDRSLMDAFEVGTTRLLDEVDIVPLRSDRRRAIRRGDYRSRVAMRHALGVS